MPRGGARSRSGPSKDPNSGRSDRLGFKLTALPAEGYAQLAPEFPLPQMRRMRWEFEDKRKFQVFDEDSTEQYRVRELEIWDEVWSTPQACAWSTQPWRWSVIAEYCRLKAVVEQEPDSNASLVAQLHRYRDQVGLTPAGLKENSWAIAVDELAERRDSQPTEPPKSVSSRDRMKAAAGGSGQ